ncbi:GNAT family N-acetyltransferase [Stomatohabitans albus]|uniref:GNAT family N-acetyltransferase n=1 Tax=Stomatohabitans albus TaxID=3110766 RepID=UPI00300CB9DC
MTDLTIRPLTPDELPDMVRAFQRLFGEETTPDSQAAEIDPLDPSRCVGAFAADRIVGHVGIYPLDIAVPGATAPLCAITLVFVDTTHRRKGLGKALMLRAMHQADEPVAALWASRPGFYERLGFEAGMASSLMSIDVGDTVPLRPNAPTLDDVRRVPPAIAEIDLPRVYDQARQFRPGLTSRDTRWWKHRFIGDAEWRRFGGGELQTVVAYRDDEPVAYAIFNLKSSFDHLGPNHEMIVHEAVAINPVDEAALLAWLCQVDLVGKVTAWWRPADDALNFCLVQPRHAETKTTESLYVRILDVPKAIAARHYFADLSCVVRIVDDHLERNNGVWRFTLGASGGRAERIADSAAVDCTMDIRGLAALWLGGYSVHTLIGAQLITIHTPALTLALHQAFSSPVAPWCPEVW